MRLSQETSAKEGGAGGSREEVARPRDWGSSSWAPAKGRGAACQAAAPRGGDWLAGRGGVGLEESPLASPQKHCFVGASWGLRGGCASCCPAASQQSSLLTHFSGFQRENALPDFHKEDWKPPQTCWFAPLPVADGPGSGHRWPRSR